MLGLDDLYSLTDDTAFHPADVYETRGKRLGARAAALVLLVLAVQWPLLLGDKFLWPDELALPRDAAVHTSAGLRAVWSVPELLQSPLGRTFLFLEYRIDSQATIFHAISILLHAMNVVLCWFLLRRLQLPGAWLAAGLFAVHPLEVQAIALVQQQERLWAAMFCLASLLFFLRGAGIPPEPEDMGLAKPGADEFEDKPRRWPMLMCYAAASILFLAAIACQPTLLAISPIFFILKTRGRKISLKDFLACVPFFAISSAAIIFGMLASEQSHAAATTHWFSSVLTTIHDAARLAVRLAWPRPIVAMFIDPPLSPYALRSYWIPCAIVAAIVFALLRKHLRIVGLIAMLICLIPSVWDARIDGVLGSLVPGRDACQYLFGLPLFAALIAWLVSLISRIHQPLQHAIARLMLGVVLIATFATAAWFSSDAHASSESLWLAAVAGDPQSNIARAQLATWYLEHGNLELAEKQSQDIQPRDDVQMLLVCGRVSEARGKLDQAIDFYNRAVQLKSVDARPVSYLAAAYLKAHRPEDAAACFENALRQYPSDPGVRSDFGLLLSQQNNLAAAIDQFREAIHLDGDFVPARINLASALFQSGDLPEAAEQLQVVVKLDPQNFEAFHNAGVMLCQLRDFPAAAQMLTMAVQLRPDSPEARNDLGVALSANGKYKRAAYEFQQAIALQPDYDAAKHNLEITQRRAAAAATLPTSQPESN